MGEGGIPAKFPFIGCINKVQSILSLLRSTSYPPALTPRLGGRIRTATLKAPPNVAISSFHTVVRMLMKMTDKGLPCRIPFVTLSHCPPGAPLWGHA